MVESVPGGFKEFFESKLKKADCYEEEIEMVGDIEFAIDNMEYDMENRDSLWEAFEKACRDLHIDKDGIENFI